MHIFLRTFVTNYRCGLHVVSRFRDDVRLQYIIPQIKTGKRGRPKKYGNAIDFENLDMNHFNTVKQENKNIKVYTAIVKAVALKRVVKVVLVHYLENDKIKVSNIYFSTKTSFEAMEILDNYQTRFKESFFIGMQSNLLTH
jgi:hypothetical protein